MKKIIFITFILVIFLIASCQQVSKYKALEIKKDEKQKIGAGEAKLVYRVGRGNLGAFRQGESCNETITLFDSSTGLSNVLLDNCKANVGILGWMSDTELLTSNFFSQKMELGELDINSREIKTLELNNISFVLNNVSFVSTSGLELSAKLVKDEPRLLQEIQKHNWVLTDLQTYDNTIIFIVVSLHNASGFYVYSWNRSLGELQQKFYDNGGLHILRMYILNDKEIIFLRRSIDKVGSEAFKADIDGSNQIKLIDHIPDIELIIGNKFIGYLSLNGNQSNVNIFDVDKKTIHEIPLNGVTRKNDISVLDFSRTTEKLAYETWTIGDFSQCALYVLDVKTGENTMLTDRCFINDVSWSQ